ncbi:hypothetical protein Tco_1214573 [Tanacetum coccineum]
MKPEVAQRREKRWIKGSKRLNGAGLEGKEKEERQWGGGGGGGGVGSTSSLLGVHLMGGVHVYWASVDGVDVGDEVTQGVGVKEGDQEEGIAI